MLKFVTQQEEDLLSEENKIIKVLAQCKSSPNGPLTSVEELYSLCNECTFTQAALHSDMNLEMRFRTLAVITIKGACTLFQQKKMTVENKMRSLTSLISSQLGFSATAEIDDLDASILNLQGKEQIILASQPPLVPKDPVKQLQGVPVPQAELREPVISVHAAIITNFQLLKIDFLE